MRKFEWPSAKDLQDSELDLHKPIPLKEIFYKEAFGCLRSFGLGLQDMKSDAIESGRMDRTPFKEHFLDYHQRVTQV